MYSEGIIEWKNKILFFFNMSYGFGLSYDSACFALKLHKYYSVLIFFFQFHFLILSYFKPIFLPGVVSRLRLLVFIYSVLPHAEDFCTFLNISRQTDLFLSHLSTPRLLVKDDKVNEKPVWKAILR